MLPFIQWKKNSHFLLFIFIAICFLLLTGRSSPDSILPDISGTAKTATKKRQAELWAKLKILLAAHPPGCPSPQRTELSPVIGFEKVAANNATDEFLRPDLLSMSVEDVTNMQTAHRNFVGGLDGKWPVGFMPNTRGIVTTAGGEYLPTLLISLRMLRKTACILPVEVFMLSSEYETDICENVLPTLNARCIILSDIIDVEITHFQLKIFSILFSVYEQVLFLDSDAFPVKDPKQYFDIEPFKSFGMITWPDFWMNTASPKYYTISSQEEPSIKERAASETGVIMIDKSSHQKTLLLAAYYNYYGPTHYYSLLSQGGAGEGDKETFIAAAAALNEPFYTISERVRSIGRTKKGGDGIAGTAMVQHDPSEDYTLTSKGIYRIRNESVAPRIHPFLIHAHFPKLNPATVFNDDHFIIPTQVDGVPSRAWLAPQEILDTFVEDMEKKVWEEVRWVACECEKCFEDWKNMSGICERVELHIKNVFLGGRNT